MRVLQLPKWWLNQVAKVESGGLARSEKNVTTKLNRRATVSATLLPGSSPEKKPEISSINEIERVALLGSCWQNICRRQPPIFNHKNYCPPFMRQPISYRPPLPAKNCWLMQGSLEILYCVRIEHMRSALRECFLSCAVSCFSSSQRWSWSQLL